MVNKTKESVTRLHFRLTDQKMSWVLSSDKIGDDSSINRVDFSVREFSFVHFFIRRHWSQLVSSFRCAWTHDISKFLAIERRLSSIISINIGSGMWMEIIGKHQNQKLSKTKFRSISRCIQQDANSDSVFGGRAISVYFKSFISPILHAAL